MGNSKSNIDNLQIKNYSDSYLPLRDVVFNTLREAILKGDLKPGERLMEVQLAKQMGVSRTPIREAIRKLELEGMAVTMPRRGAVVAKMTEKDMEDVLQVRRALEELAASIACDQISMSQIKDLKAAMNEFEKQTKAGDIKEITDADVAFHDIIYKSTGNRRLMAIMKGFGEQMYRYRVEYLKEEENYPTLIDEHREIVEGLQRRDKNAVVEIMHRHVTNQAVEMKKIIRDQNQEGV